MLKTPEHKEERIWFRAESSLLKRCDAVAEARFGGNRSLVIRRAIERFVSDLEREISADTEGRAA